MPILASGSNVTLTVAAGQVLTVQSDQATFDFENPVGTRVGEFASDMTFGPFSAAGSVKITSVQGPVFYDLASPVAGGTTPYNPASVAITGGVVGTGAAVTVSRDFVLADSLNTLRVNSASPVSLNLPAGLPVGFSCAVVQMGAGKVTITAGAGVTMFNSGSLFGTSAQYAVIGVIQTATNEYVVSGSVG